LATGHSPLRCPLDRPSARWYTLLSEPLTSHPSRLMIESVIRDVVSKLPGAEHRPQQIEMARIIEKAIATGRHALIEAGTGSGKSFGYLLPILESGNKAVISTGTLALQEQLLGNDIPLLQPADQPDLS